MQIFRVQILQIVLFFMQFSPLILYTILNYSGLRLLQFITTTYFQCDNYTNHQTLHTLHISTYLSARYIFPLEMPIIFTCDLSVYQRGSR